MPDAKPPNPTCISCMWLGVYTDIGLRYCMCADCELFEYEIVTPNTYGCEHHFASSAIPSLPVVERSAIGSIDNTTEETGDACRASYEAKGGSSSETSMPDLKVPKPTCMTVIVACTYNWLEGVVLFNLQTLEQVEYFARENHDVMQMQDDESFRAAVSALEKKLSEVIEVCTKNQ